MYGRETILNMPAGREMDALVAEKVMEWQRIRNWHGQPIADGWVGFWDGEWIVWIERPLSDEEDQSKPWQPSTDIAAAWKVVEKVDLMIIPIAVYSSAAAWDEPKILPIKIWWAALRTFSDPSIYLPIEEYDKEWEGWVNLIDQSITLDMVAETAPLAICRAALLAVMEE